MKWRPLASAPKDGTHILCNSKISDTCYVICWVDASKKIRANLGRKVGWHIAYDGDFIEPWAEPTHWMPLPKRPERTS